MPLWCHFKGFKGLNSLKYLSYDLSKMRGIRVTFRIKISSIKDSKFHFNHKILECGSFSLVYLIRELDDWLFYLTNQSFEWLVFWIDFSVMNWLCVCIEPLIQELNRSTPNLLLCHFGYVYRVRRSHNLLPLSVLCIILLSTIFLILLQFNWFGPFPGIS